MTRIVSIELNELPPRIKDDVAREQIKRRKPGLAYCIET
jgi:hypothetical protein